MDKKVMRSGATLALAGLLLVSTVSVTGSPPGISLAKKKIARSRTKAEVKSGGSVTLTLKNVPAKFKKKVKWSTSNKKVATVKAKKNPRKAVVKVVAEGEATITARYKKKAYKCKVIAKDTGRADPSASPEPEASADPSASPEASADPSASPEPTATSTPIPSYKSITQEEAREMMKRDDGHVIVDVRRLSEYTTGHIEGAILIPNESITTERPAKLPDLNQIILVYCRSGNRSKQASQKLGDMGYTQVYEFGGINTWAGPIVK